MSNFIKAMNEIEMVLIFLSAFNYKSTDENITIKSISQNDHSKIDVLLTHCHENYNFQIKQILYDSETMSASENNCVQGSTKAFIKYYRGETKTPPELLVFDKVQRPGIDVINDYISDKVNNLYPSDIKENLDLLIYLDTLALKFTEKCIHNNKQKLKTFGFRSIACVHSMNYASVIFISDKSPKILRESYGTIHDLKKGDFIYF
ncbi:Uncharacterised protein [Legionella steigerwaltii]|uniref:Uncharacterized protein n=1 Tax=Legionella steigerwaltii TaxID=460 RepID=A0A378LB70_9GAMM|nr:hypothetical protein [Legionella steigerwaltii]KTD78970.1 hypothetical protein Lstg_0927 [Legionella steigerwaltii]STY23560.1 Uncharacterised protein [Legionella steigerwaltii]